MSSRIVTLNPYQNCILQSMAVFESNNPSLNQKSLMLTADRSLAQKLFRYNVYLLIMAINLQTNAAASKIIVMMPKHLPKVVEQVVVRLICTALWSNLERIYVMLVIGLIYQDWSYCCLQYFVSFAIRHLLYIYQSAFRRTMSILNRKRMHSRSNEALIKLIQPQPQYQYPSGSPSLSPSTHTSINHIISSELEQRSLFKESYCKIQSLKSMLIYKTASKSLVNELNDIIDLIKGERVKAKFAIQELAQQARHAEEANKQSSARGKVRGSIDAAVNTDDIVIDELKDAVDAAVQVNIDNRVETKGQSNSNKAIDSQKKYETYYKLACMIDKLKVDYRQILPILHNFPSKYVLPDVQLNKNTYKILKPDEILKLQKVFMTKLRGMIIAQQPKPPLTEPSPVSISIQTLSLAVTLVKQSKESATPIKVKDQKQKQKERQGEQSTGNSKINSQSKSSSKSKSKSKSNKKQALMQQSIKKQKKFESMMQFV